MPYDGLFLPYQAEWNNLGPANPGLEQYNVTTALMDAYYKRFQQQGLQSLAYFDLANWGVNVTLPAANDTPASCGTRPGGLPAPCPTVAGM
jgi:hypothetical protein